MKSNTGQRGSTAIKKPYQEGLFFCPSGETPNCCIHRVSTEVFNNQFEDISRETIKIVLQSYATEYLDLTLTLYFRV